MQAQASSPVVIQSLDVDGAATMQAEEVKLCSLEGEVFVISRTAVLASKSQVLTVALNTGGDLSTTKIGSVTLRNVQAFLDYSLQHPFKPIPKPLPSCNLEKFIPAVYANLVNNLAHGELFELIKAANYLDLTDLLDLACAKIASLIKNKTPDQIRTTFDIVNDFTPEEEDDVQAQNAWSEASSVDMES